MVRTLRSTQTTRSWSHKISTDTVHFSGRQWKSSAQSRKAGCEATQQVIQTDKVALRGTLPLDSNVGPCPELSHGNFGNRASHR
jgi:hypothetical protein